VISETNMVYGDIILYLVIHNCSSMNVISKYVLMLLTLKPILYYTPIKVASFDVTNNLKGVKPFFSW